LPTVGKPFTIVIVVVLVVAAIGGGIFYFAIWPKISDDDDGDPNNPPPGKNRKPYARFKVHYEGLHPVVGEEIWFNASESSDPNGDSLTYSWDFSDFEDLDSDGDFFNDNQKTGMNVSWTYTVNETYYITLKVNDSELSDDYKYALVVRLNYNEELPSALLTCTGKKEGFTGSVYLVSVGSVDVLQLAANYSVAIYDVGENETTIMYLGPMTNLTSEIIYRDLDNDDMVSQGDTFQVTPSAALPADDGDLFSLVYMAKDVGMVPLTSYGL